MTSRTIATVLVVAILSVTAAGESQTPDPFQVYQSAVASYMQSRDISRAVTPLQQWSASEFDAAVKATLASGNPPLIKAAAIFHLEIGVALVGVSSASAAGHIGYGVTLLDRWTATQPALNPAAVGDQKQFRSIWFGVAGSAFAAIKELGRARPLLNKSIAALPRSARAKTLLGTLKEFEASQYQSRRRAVNGITGTRPPGTAGAVSPGRTRVPGGAAL